MIRSLPIQYQFLKKLSYHCFFSEEHSEVSNTDVNSSILTCHIVTNIRHKLQINPNFFTYLLDNKIESRGQI
jgi:hypothetical protein